MPELPPPGADISGMKAWDDSDGVKLLDDDSKTSLHSVQFDEQTKDDDRRGQFNGQVSGFTEFEDDHE